MQIVTITDIAKSLPIDSKVARPIASPQVRAREGHADALDVAEGQTATVKRLPKA
jgi:hypothetical protein